MNILVTGASGQLGSQAIEFIQTFSPDTTVYGLVRSEEQASRLEELGAIPRLASYEDKGALVKAFEGIDRLLFVSVPNFDLQKNIVEAAKVAGVKYLVYTSFNGLEYSKFNLEQNHIQTEELIKNSGIPYTFLRNGWYLEVDPAIIKAAVKTGKFYYTSDGKISMTVRRDYAEAAARVILNAENPTILTLTRKAFSYEELGHALQKVIGHSMEMNRVDADTYAKALTEAGIEGFEQTMSLSMQAYVVKGENGEENTSQAVFEEVLGHELPNLEEMLESFLEK